MPNLTAGIGVVELAPIDTQALYGYPHVPRVLTGVHDPLFASTLVLDNGQGRVVIVSLDLLFLDPPTSREIRRRTAEIVKTNESKVFIACTHTHSGPVTTTLLSWRNDPAVPAPDVTFLKTVAQCVYKSTQKAMDNIAPVEIRWTAAHALGVGGNRHSPDGLTDPECGILVVRKTGCGELIAAVVIYGMHPTVLHESSTLVSSDFPHYVRLALRKRLRQDLCVVYLNAPCGNQSPRHFTKSNTFGEAERLGSMLGNSIADAIDRLMDNTDSAHGPVWSGQCNLGGRISAVHLVLRSLPSVNQSRAALDAANKRYKELEAEKAPRPELRTAECAIFGAEGAVELAKAQESGAVDALLRRYEPFEVQLLTIGDVNLVGLPGEVFTEYSLRIKERTRAKTYVVSFVNGEMQGYIVTPEAERDGGYEAANALFAPESGNILVETVVRMTKDDTRH